MKNGRRYRYYTSQAVIRKRKKPSYLDRIPAKELEQLVSSRVQKFLASPDQFAAACAESGWPQEDLGRVIDAARALVTDWSKLTSAETADILRRSIRQATLCGSEVRIQVDVAALSARASREGAECIDAHEGGSLSAAHLFTLTAPLTVARYRGELRLAFPGDANSSDKSGSSLLKAVVRAQRWKQRILNGEIYCKEQLANEANLNASYVGRILRLAALGPECIDAVVQHRKVFDQPLSGALKGIPLDWSKQEGLLLRP